MSATTASKLLLRPHQLHGLKPFVSRVRIGLVRYSSTNSHAKPPPKTFDQIAKEMAEKSRRIRRGPKFSKISPLFQSRKIAGEIGEPLAVGDLVLVNLDPHVVLKTPDSPTEKFVLVNHVGLIKETRQTNIEARLMPLVPSPILEDPEFDIYASEDTTGATLQITTNGQETGDTSLDKPAGRVVNWWVYRLISMPLRHVYEEATQRAQQILPSVLQHIQSLQHASVPQVVPLMTFVEQATDCPKGEASIVDFYATRICLDHYSLEYKYQLSMSYSSADAIMVLPKAMEKRLIQMQASGETDMSFLHDYARGNLPMGSSESRAIEFLRNIAPESEYVDSGVAAEMLKLPRGGVYENGWFQWMFEAAKNSSRNTAILGHQQEDNLKMLRETYDQPVYCIDSPDAKEVDDGISIERAGPSVYKLGIHIANPSAFLNVKEALSDILPLTTSVYLSTNKTIPMLPSELVEPINLLSNTGAKPSLSMFAELDINSGEIQNIQIKPLMLTNIYNVDSSKVSRSVQNFNEFYAVAMKLLKKRYNNGAFSFRTYVRDEFKSIMNAGTRPDGEVIVTEFMNLANHLVAKYCSSNKIPVLYRSQFLQVKSTTMKKKLAMHREETGGLLGLVWRPIAQRGSTSVTPSGHTGIGVDIATRFTSPLRRLDDMITHAQLGAHLLNRDLPFDTESLAEICDWMQLSQELGRRLSRLDTQFDKFVELKPGQDVEGVVSSVEPDVKNPSEGNIVIYLPHHQVNAKFAGAEKLELERAYTFTIAEVSAAGRYANVTIKKE